MPRSVGHGPLTSLLAGPVLVGAGTVIGASGVVPALHGTAARDWPVVSGEVLGAGTRTVRERRARETAPDVRSRSTTAAGCTFEGPRRRFGDRLSGDDPRQPRLELEPGHGIPVRHHPDRPEIAVIRPGAAGSLQARAGIGPVLAGFGASAGVGRSVLMLVRSD